MRFYFAFLCAAASIVVAGCNSDSGKTAGADAGGSKSAVGHVQKLVTDDIKVGTGPKVENGDEVWVRYTGKLTNGTVFDSNKGSDKPVFKVSVGQPGGVIEGWNVGLVGMQKGGTRKLSIPYSMGYGAKGNGKIPGYADLIFDIDLVYLLKAKDEGVITADDVKVGTGREAKTGDTITIDYEATVFGEVVDSTKTPLALKMGGDQFAIPGFDSALAGMKVGGERKVTIPPQVSMPVLNDKVRNNLVVYDVHLLKIQ